MQERKNNSADIERILELSSVKSSSELFRSNPTFMHLCKRAGLELEEILEIDELRIRKSLKEGFTIATLRNRDNIQLLWNTYDPTAIRTGAKWTDYCLNIDIKELRKAGLEAQKNELETRLRAFLQMNMYAGTACQPISLRQLGSAVGIKNVEEVNRIIRKWLDEGAWLGLVEAGKPTPNSRKANVYQLIESSIVSENDATSWKAFIAPLKCDLPYEDRIFEDGIEFDDEYWFDYDTEL